MLDSPLLFSIYRLSPKNAISFRMMKKSGVLALLLIFTGCYARNPLNDKGVLLNVTASNYYNLIMWKHYDRASVFIAPDKRDEYKKFVLDYQEKLNITSYKIEESLYESEMDEGLVKVRFNYYKYPSVSEKTALLEDEWVLREGKWYVHSDFDGEVFE